VLGNGQDIPQNHVRKHAWGCISYGEFFCGASEDQQDKRGAGIAEKNKADVEERDRVFIAY
jgi:predicted oxidoreductase